ncbi:hypothetical protein MHYP_G00177550 [Metynnis hypsauchen]
MEPALCFSDPKEMLSILTELEEQNLSFVQNFHETEEAMDVIRKTAQHSQDKMNQEIQHLRQQIEIMQATIQREQENVLVLQLKSKIFSYGEYRADKQDNMLKLLNKKVKIREEKVRLKKQHQEERLKLALEPLQTAKKDGKETHATLRTT